MLPDRILHGRNVRSLPSPPPPQLWSLVFSIYQISYFFNRMFDRPTKALPEQPPKKGLRYRVETLLGLTGLKLARERASWSEVAMAPLRIIWRPHLLSILVFEVCYPSLSPGSPPFSPLLPPEEFIDHWCLCRVKSFMFILGLLVWIRNRHQRHECGFPRERPLPSQPNCNRRSIRHPGGTCLGEQYFLVM